MFTLTIETDGAAFADDQLPEELATILRRVAGTLTCLTLGNPDTGKVRDTNGNTVGAWSFAATIDYPEGTTAECLHCGAAILLDQREGGGPGKDWGSDPADWVGHGGSGMDYGCGLNPESDEDGTAGHAPDPNTIAAP